MRAEKYHIGDRVIAIKGLYKNHPSRIMDIIYPDDYNEPFYVLDGLPQAYAYTSQSNLRRIGDNEIIIGETIEDMGILIEVSNNLSIAVDSQHRFRRDRHFVPHFHFYHLQAKHSYFECNDIEYEYGGALSIASPYYVIHDNHTEKLSAADATALNEYFADKLNWKWILDSVLGNTANALRFRIMRFRRPPKYFPEMDEIYIDKEE